MLDWYTKTVLTVIAVSLATIAVRGTVIPNAIAGDRACGDYSNPCYIATKSGGLDINVKR